MPKTKKALERKYPNYTGKQMYYQFSKYFENAEESIHYYFPEYYDEYLNFNLSGYIVPEKSDDKIEGLDGSNACINEEGLNKINTFLQNKAGKHDEKIAADNHPLKQYALDVNYVYNPSNGDLMRMSISNPSLRAVVNSSVGGFSLFYYPNGLNKDPDTIALRSQETVNELGEDIANQLNKYFHSMRKVVELEYKRQKDLDNNLATVNEKQYLKEYKAALNELVQAYDTLVEMHEARKGNEFKGPLQNNLSDITGVDKSGYREHIGAAIAGLKDEMIAIEKGWGADELGIISFLGQTQGEITIQEEILADDKVKLAGMKDGPDKDKLKRKIEQNEEKIRTFKEEFDPLYDECIGADVTNNRPLKVEITKKLMAFSDKYRGHLCMYNAPGKGDPISSIDMAADNVLDPYGMKGLSKADQLKDFMDDLNAVDGTFQRSSTNFKELRARLEELNELAKKYPEKMNEEQLVEYLTKIEEVKAAGKTYLAGKKEEERLYKESHNGAELPRKDITKRRIGFVTELESRLGCHMEASFSNEVTIPEDLSQDKRTILSVINDGKITDVQVRDYVKAYIMTEYKKVNNVKDQNMSASVEVLLERLNLSFETGKELKEYLILGTQSGVIKELAAEAEAPAEMNSLKVLRYDMEVKRVNYVLDQFTHYDKETLVLDGNDGIGEVSAEARKDIYDKLNALKNYLESVSETQEIDYNTYFNLKENAKNALRLEQHDRLNILSNILVGYVFENHINLLENMNPDAEYKAILTRLGQFDQKRLNAEKEYFKTGYFQGETLHDELLEIKNSLDAYFSNRPMNEVSQALMEEINNDLTNLKCFGEYTEEKNKITTLYIDAMKLHEEEKADEAKLKQGKMIDLKTDTVLKSGDNPVETLKKMMADEAKRRKDLIADLDQNDKKEAAFSKIISSACRSLYMEMLMNRYGKDVKPEDRANNDKKLRYAISHGFKDKENMKQFAEMLFVGKFGTYFKQGLKDRIKEKNTLDHEDILYARNNAIWKEYSEAMPDYKKEEKVEKKRNRVVNRESVNDKPEINKKRMSAAGKENGPDFARADNIRQLDKMLGAGVLKSVYDFKFPVNKDNPKLKDINIKTDYVEKQKPEPRKIGMK